MPVIFETNFQNDGNFARTNTPHGSWTGVQDNPPEGISGVVVDSNGRIYGVPGSGEGGSVAMKVEYADAKSDPENMFYVHLTGDRNVGYSEVYVRYNVRFPNGHIIGNPAADDIPFWKWLRLWQNTGPTEPGGDWTENRADSGYVVNNWSGEATYGYRTKHTFSAATGANLSEGSNGGERYSSDWYNGIPADFTTAPGYFNAMGGGDWDFNPTTRTFNNNPQGWHTVEWRFKLASSPTANDGVFQIWYDGVEQTPVQTISPGGGAPVLGDLAPNEIPTAGIAPSNGWNMLTVFDNMSGNVHSEWDAPHIGAGETRNPEDINNGVWLNDIVVSTERIGHTYQAGTAGGNNMALGFNITLRTNRLQQITDALDAGAGAAVIKIYDGTRPATGGAATTLLATLTCSNPATATNTGGVLTLDAIADDTSADATGTATWFRMEDSNGTQVADGNVGTSGSDLNLNSVAFTTGDVVSITSFTITEGNA